MKRRSPRARNRRARAAAVVCLGATAVIALPAGAAASPRLRPATVAAPGEAERVLRYWTPARMRAARPLGATHADLANPFAQASFARVRTPNVPPYSYNGLLFVRQGRTPAFCSATAIDTPTRRLVLTAGHCLNSGPRRFGRPGVWSSFVEFVPAYANGTAPFGAFVARRNAVFAPRQWVRFANPNFDVGAILVKPNAAGAKVADAVGGGAKIAANLSRRQSFQTFGYPGNSTVLQGCDSPYVGDDSFTYRIPGPPTMAIRCHWGPGASGGGWLTEGGTVINGITSYGRPRDKVHTFSPYFSARNVGHLVAGL
jgi:V8-like Glu-specific endopeptidase